MGDQPEIGCIELVVTLVLFLLYVYITFKTNERGQPLYKTNGNLFLSLIEFIKSDQGKDKVVC